MGDWWNPWAWINRQAEEAEQRRQEAERLRQEEDERKRQEEERLRQEEAERQRLAEEERKRQEEERLRQEEAERQRLATEEQKRQDDLAAQGQDLAHEMGIGATLAGSMSGFRQLEEKMAKVEESSGADFRLLDEQSQREQEAEEKRKQEEERTKAQEYLFAINVFGSVEDFKKSVIGRADEAVEWAKTKGEEVAQTMKEKELREALRRDEEARDREGQEAAKQEEAKRQELNEALTRDEDARSREGKEREDEFAEWRDSEAVFQSPSSDESDVTPLTKEQEERRVELSVNTSRTEEETDELVALSNQSRKWDIYRYDQDKRQKENEKNNLAKVNSVKSTMPEEKMIAFAKTMPQGSTTNLEVAVGDILIEKYLRGQLDTYNDKKLEESVIHLLRRRVTVDQKGGNGMFSNEDGLATRDMLRRKFETSGGAGIDLKSIKTTENELYKLRTLLAVDTGNKAYAKDDEKAIKLGSRRDDLSGFSIITRMPPEELKKQHEVVEKEIDDLRMRYKKENRENEFENLVGIGGIGFFEGLATLALARAKKDPMVEDSAEYFVQASNAERKFILNQNELKISGQSPFEHPADMAVAGKIRYFMELPNIGIDIAGEKAKRFIFTPLREMVYGPALSYLPDEISELVEDKVLNFISDTTGTHLDVGELQQKKNEFLDELAVVIVVNLSKYGTKRAESMEERLRRSPVIE